MDKNFRDIVDFHAKLQGLANALGKEIVDALDATDAKLLAMLTKELQSVRRQLIIGNGPSKKIHERLQEIERRIGEIRKTGIQNALKIARGTVGDAATLSAQRTAEEIAALVAEAKAGREYEKNIRQRIMKSTLTDREIDRIVEYQPFDGASIAKWFEKMQRTDLDRIFQEVQRGVVDGTSLAGIMNRIRGTAAQGYSDGILQASRNSARMLGRTVINGAANASRMEVYRKNADVIDGVKWLATLDSRTCPICGSLDGTIWKPDRLNEVKQPPAHPSCRCVLIPYVDLGPEFEATRSAAVENFDELAEKRYHEERKTGKPWNKLSYETRQKKRNDEIRKYEAVHGEGSAFRQVKASDTFEDYLKESTKEFRREYLGSSRAEAFEKGTLKLDQMVSPDGGFVRTVEQLRNDGSVPPKEPPKTAEGEADGPRYRRLTMEENLLESEEFRKVLSVKEIAAFNRYTMGESGWINSYLRGKTNQVRDAELIETLQQALNKWKSPDDIVLMRGTGNSFITSVFGDGPVVAGIKYTDDAFVSTSFDEIGAFSNKPVLLEIRVPKGTSVGPLTEISASRDETEWLLPHGLRYAVKEIRSIQDGRTHLVIEVVKRNKKRSELGE